MKPIIRCTGLLAVVLAGGCGTRINDALLAALESGTRSAGDVFLADLYTDLPNLFTFPPAIELPPLLPPDTGGTGDTNGDSGGSGTDQNQPPAENLAGDPASGSAFFMMNSCSACHCEDASGGCLADAPSLLDVNVETLRDFLLGDAMHPGGKFADLTEQGLADLKAYLEELAAG